MNGEVIHDAVKDTFKNAKSLPLPPTFGSVKSNDRKPPIVCSILFETLLSKNPGNPNSWTDRLVDFFRVYCFQF